jgi:putative transposase
LKSTGADVYEQELGELAADFLQRTVWSGKCINKGTVLHSDNGSPMRSFTMQTKMRDLGVPALTQGQESVTTNPILNHCLEPQNIITHGQKMALKPYQKQGVG